MDRQAELLKEWDQEMAASRKTLERVPDGNPDWKPHPKSFSVAHLAQLVAGMPSWIEKTLLHPDLDLKKQMGYSNQKTSALLETFDKGVAASRAAIAQTSGAAWDEPWSLKMGDHVLMTMSRKDVVRQHINHLVHHRAQLGVYLRLLDVPVPSCYGPTADEKWG
jgi:uncharacterized damage-inducible protein DinB